MTIALSAIAICVAISSFAYTFWADGPATRKADVAWAAKLTLEQAIVTLVYAFSTELKFHNEGLSSVSPGSIMRAATENGLS